VDKILGQLYRRHRQGLFTLALSITRSPADAEDAVHDAFTRLCSGSQNAGANPVPYIFAAVRNAAIDRLRSRQRDPGPIGSLTPCLNGQDHPAADRERDQAIAAAIDSLPDEFREIVFLRIFGSLTFRQIGELLESPLQTVASRYDAALEKLRPQLRKWL
jgi:RNA polymerase sigma-70 factor (ECF subfamily)